MRVLARVILVLGNSRKRPTKDVDAVAAVSPPPAEPSGPRLRLLYRMLGVLHLWPSAFVGRLLRESSLRNHLWAAEWVLRTKGRPKERNTRMHAAIAARHVVHERALGGPTCRSQIPLLEKLPRNLPRKLLSRGDRLGSLCCRCFQKIGIWCAW